MLVITCPGQGSQKPGFLTPWLEHPVFRETIDEFSEVVELDLTAHGTTSDAATIQDTAIAQPLIVAAGVATYRLLFAEPTQTSTVGAIAGHSVGEITAAVIAGVLSTAEGAAFVRERSRGMAAASAAAPTGMSAVIGGDQQEVISTLESFSLAPANINGGGQIVAAGSIEQLAQLKENPPTKARVIPLKVAGAFHTHYMASAVPALQELQKTFHPQNPQLRILSNADGKPVDDGAEFLAKLVNQVTQPVRWDLCQETLAAEGATELIELAPAGTLVGLAKRALSGVQPVAVNTPDDIEKVQQLITASLSGSAEAKE